MSSYVAEFIKSVFYRRRSSVRLEGYVYTPETGELIINFEATEAAKPLFASTVIRLKYMTSRPQSVTEVEAADIFCAFTMPHLAAQNISADIHGSVTKTQFVFWNEYCAKLLEGTVPKTSFRLQSGSHNNSTSPSVEAATEKIALLFGGGVESLTALSDFLNQKPLLLSLVGPLWMNNNYEASGLKRDIEDHLVSKFDLEIARVWHNLKEVVVTPDEYMNKYLTGGLMYYLFMPVVREKNCSVIYHSMENEYLMVNEQYDRSIHPLFSRNVARSSLVPLQTIMTEYTKIELLDRLYKNNPRLCSFLYSCLNNTDLRWCGTCGKCRRLSAFCEAIGIEKSLIGMEEGIAYVPETGVLTRMYWKNLEIYKSRQSSSTAAMSAKGRQ